MVVGTRELCLLSNVLPHNSTAALVLTPGFTAFPARSHAMSGPTLPRPGVTITLVRGGRWDIGGHTGSYSSGPYPVYATQPGQSYLNMSRLPRLCQSYPGCAAVAEISVVKVKEEEEDADGDDCGVA